MDEKRHPPSLKRGGRIYRMNSMLSRGAGNAEYTINVNIELAVIWTTLFGLVWPRRVEVRVRKHTSTGMSIQILCWTSLWFSTTKSFVHYERPKRKKDFQNMNTQAILSRLTMLRKIVTHGTYSGSSQAEFIASNNCTHEMLNKMSTYWIELVEEDRWKWKVIHA